MVELAVLVVVVSAGACGKDDGSNSATAGSGRGGDAAAGGMAGSDVTPGAGGEDNASGASGSAAASGNSAGGGSSSAGAAGDASGGGAGIVVLYRRPGMGGAIADWDPETPRPLVIFNKGTLDDVWRPTNALFYPSRHGASWGLVGQAKRVLGLRHRWP
jgi:hypothetical protein